MRDLLMQVMDLQSDWTTVNTEEMQVRGRLVRDEMPEWLRAHLPIGERGIRVHGQDGVGLKAQVPWVRLFDPSLSPDPTDGWYLAYLFAADGMRCYLTLSHGSMERRDGRFYPRGPAQTAQLLAWARDTLALTGSEAGAAVDLAAKSGTTGSNYAKTVAWAIEYDRAVLPGNDELLADVAAMLQRLDLVYVADRTDPTVPGRPPAEIVLALDELDDAVNPLHPKKHGGRGFRVSKAEQRAVEQRAVNLTTEHLSAAGWEVSDVGSHESFDLDCRRDGERLYVEVKGTTSNGASVILTRNEVALHKDTYPHNALAVVSLIALDRSVEPPVATGGTLRLIQPWLIDDADLSPLAYTYDSSVLQGG